MRLRARAFLVLASVAALLGSLALVPTAQAAFPGDNGKIAFTRQQSDGTTDVYVVNPDGTGLTNLTSDYPGYDDEQPAISADGSKIAFASDRTDSFEIWVMDADGSHQTQVTDFPTTFDWEPAWSPDGTQLVFQRLNGPNGLRIWDLATSTTSGVSDPGWSPDWEPTGDRIAFETYFSTLKSAELFTIVPGAAGSLVQLTDNTRAEDDPDWSPDGTRIVFNQFDFDGSLQINNELWTVRSDGVGLSLLYDDQDAFQPTFSPDGTKVAFQQNDDIVWISATGGTPTTIVGGSTWDYDPDWGPVPTEPTTGELIAFTSGRDDNAEIYIMGPNGGNQTRLTNNTAMDDYAAISPDGTRIAFTSWRDLDGDAEIYVMESDGSDVTQITTNTGYDAEPTWSSDGEALMFVSDRSGSSQLWFTVLDPPMTFGPYAAGGVVSNFSPDWSDQGVVYVSDESGNNDLYTFIPDGTVTTQLTDDPASDYAPDWSHAAADAIHHHVLFVRGAPGEGDIWDLTIEQSAETQETFTPNLWESSPSGRWDETYFAFARATPGDLSTAQIWTRDMEGGFHQITTSSGGNYNPDWGPCSLDAEGFCGAVPVPPPVRHVRAITLDLTQGDLFASGKVTCEEGFAACRADVPVRIERKSPNGWKLVILVQTNENGKYKQDLPDAEGTYRAVAKKVRLGADVCGPAISDKVEWEE